MSREDLLRLACLIHGLTRDLTQVVARPLGPGLDTNRPVDLLLRIHHEPDVTAADLVRRLGVSASFVSQALAPMVAADLVVRVPDPRDHRVSHLRLTEVGRQRVRAFEDRLRRHFVDNEPVVKEACDLLGVELGTSGSPVTLLRAAGGLARAGDRYTRDARAEESGLRTLDRSQRFVLVLLRIAPSRPRDLAAQVGLSASGLSDAVDRLERAGLVRRRGGQLDDRRGVLVEPTSAGIGAADEEVDLIGRHARPMLEALVTCVAAARTSEAR